MTEPMIEYRGKLYPEAALTAAVATVTVERAARALEHVSTQRGAFRAMRALMTPAMHESVMREALRRVESGTIPAGACTEDALVASFSPLAPKHA